MYQPVPLHLHLEWFSCLFFWEAFLLLGGSLLLSFSSLLDRLFLHTQPWLDISLGHCILHCHSAHSLQLGELLSFCCGYPFGLVQNSLSCLDCCIQRHSDLAVHTCSIGSLLYLLEDSFDCQRMDSSSGNLDFRVGGTLAGSSDFLEEDTLTGNSDFRVWRAFQSG